MEDKYLTKHQGSPVTDNQNSLTIGEHELVVLQDTRLIEKFAYLDCERIPERVVHAKGARAHGYFQDMMVGFQITKRTKSRTASK